MKLTQKTKKILKIATVSALAVLEIYLIYAAAASMYTFHQHPRFESADGQIAQSSGYRTQFFLCLAFAIAIPFVSGVISYFMFFKKPRADVSSINGAAIRETAATDSVENFDDPDFISIDGCNENDESTHLKPL